MKTFTIGCVCALLFFSIACGATTRLTSKEMYKQCINLELPETMVSDFNGGENETFPIFASTAYFTYKITPGYFDLLEKHNLFIETSEFNESIHEVVCDNRSFPKDFSYWTHNVVDLRDKICYTGTFFPYVHYFVHDPSTNLVQHFVTGMRD